jgi:hypothetical protein
MGVMNIICAAGDEIVEWDPNDDASVLKAKEEWDRLKAEGFEFFEPVEGKGKRVTRFSKNLGRVIAAPGVKKPTDKTQGTRPKAMAGGPNDALVLR